MRHIKTIITILVTAVITCIISSTVCISLIIGNNGQILYKISAVTKLLRDYSIYPLDDDILADNASRAVTASVGDIYTMYMSAEEYSDYMEILSGTYLGVGITLTTEDDKVIISDINEDGPTANSDILIGDILYKADDILCTSENISEVIKMIRSKTIGEDVRLTVLRNNTETNVKIPVQEIYQKPVTGMMISDNIGYVKIESFSGEVLGNSRSAYDDFVDMVAKLSSEGMKKMIIDLRDNPGGGLEVVTSICDEIMSEGLITYTEDKYGKQDRIYAKSGGLDYPIAVITNSGSASASEVLTSALKDNGLAVTVGEKTYGKGVVQTYFSLPDGSAISITSARYYTPKGVCIDGIGIEPDVYCTLAEGKTMADYTPENDPQILCAVEELNKR